MSLLDIDFSSDKNIAVAVSGGGDSLALALLLSGWVKDQDIQLHALTVDHGLRPESATEAKMVAKILKPFGITHKILKWDGQKPKTRIQEAAREARYSLMSNYCAKKKIKHLCVAHHAQDQIETILFRMAKGTGIDGLSGMHPAHILDNGLTILRPLLPVSHQELLETLKSQKIDWIEDPSNANDRYARVRIRNVINVLENEGLSAERISSLTKRIHNSIRLIDYLIDKEYKNLKTNYNTERIEINISEFTSLPMEGRIRILKLIIADLNPEKQYPARLEDIERLAYKIDGAFKGSTLGKCLFRKKKDRLVVITEHPIH